MPALKLSNPTGRFALAALAAAGMCLTRPVRAQDAGYHVGEKQTAPDSVPSESSRTYRLAKIEYLSGKVTYRPDDAAKWTHAETNYPLGVGSQLWVEEGGRAEVRFDDGSILRVGSNSVITLQTVYMDAEGEYTQITMNHGIATLEPREARSVFEVNTPFLTVKTTGPSRVRIGVSDDIEVAVSRGRANLEGPSGKTSLSSGDFVSQRASDTAYAIHGLPSPDSWERWNEARDRKTVEDAYPRRPAPSRSYSSFYFSLGFPIFGGDRHDGFRVYGHGEYHRHW